MRNLKIIGRLLFRLLIPLSAGMLAFVCIIWGLNAFYWAFGGLVGLCLLTMLYIWRERTQRL